jgi:hypothetical protein
MEREYRHAPSNWCAATLRGRSHPISIEHLLKDRQVASHQSPRLNRAVHAIRLERREQLTYSHGKLPALLC